MRFAMTLLVLGGTCFAQSAAWDAYMDQAQESYSLGDYYKAERLYRLATKEAERIDPDGPRMAGALYGLGLALAGQWDHEAAEPLYRKALEIRRKAFGDEHRYVAAVLMSLGVALKNRTQVLSTQVVSSQH